MKLLLIDDHPIFRQGLTAALQAIDTHIIVEEADSVTAALQHLENLDVPELILLDINLELENGLAKLHLLQQSAPGVPIVIISATQEPWQIQWALESGARGFIPKATSGALASRAIQLVLRGGDYWPQPLETNPGVRVSNFSNPLTNRQVEVLALMAKGIPNKKIATNLGIRDTTVRTHVTDILKSLNAKNRTEAVYYAARQGWLTQEFNQ